MRTVLESRQVRRQITGNGGIRQIDFENNATTSTGQKKGLLSTFVSWVKQQTIGRFIGWIGSGALNLGRGLLEGIIDWTWGLATDIAINFLEGLYEFDWNQTDEELAQKIEGGKVSLATIWGGFIARGIVKIGTIVVSSKIFLPVPVISKPALSAYIKANALPEAVQETVAEFRQAVTSTVTTLTQMGWIKIFGWSRIGLKGIGNWLEKNANWDPGANKILQKWGQKDGPELSLEQVVNDKVEKIKTPWIKAFVESALEGAWEGFTDGLIMVADDIDSFIENEKEDENRVLGDVRAVEVLPDRTNNDERLLFYGYQNTVMGDIMSTLNTYQLIHNRDIGFQQEDYQQEMLLNKVLIKRQLKLFWKTRKSPPWTTRQQGSPQYKRVQITIPHAKPGVTWDSIKKAMGGSDGVSVGGWRATAVTDKGLRPCFFGASQQDAIANLERLLSLSELKILSLSTSLVVQSKRARREPLRFYPAHIHTYQAFPASGRSGREFADGSRASIKQRKIEMWREKPLDEAPIFTAI